MDTELVVTILRDGGGYGMEAVFFWLYRVERLERQRYRDEHEKTLAELPALTRALEDLSDGIKEHF